MEQDKLSLESTPFNLLDVIDQSFNIVALSAEKKGIKLSSTVGENFPAMFIGDPARFRQILVNLLSNSVKFSNKGTVSLSVKMRKSREILICVRDEGVGIPKEAQQTIFQPFFQADSSVSRKYGGTGI